MASTKITEAENLATPRTTLAMFFVCYNLLSLSALQAPYTWHSVPSLAMERAGHLLMASRDDELRAKQTTLESKRLATEVTDGAESRGSRFSRAWGTLEQDVDWIQTIGERVVDAVDDVVARGGGLALPSLPFLPAGPALGADTASAAGAAVKKRVVVLGSGWGSNAVLKQLAGDFELKVVSPRNYFLFTPMLAGAAVGTLEPRSIIEPIREAMPPGDMNEYYEAAATEIDAERKTVRCESVECKGVVCEVRSFELEYDTLVVSVGSASNTFGVKGVREHCLFLKQLSDALRFREQLGVSFERASLPGLSDEERVATLTFVVIGAGPTGVELCGELRDFVANDVPRLYPALARRVLI